LQCGSILRVAGIRVGTEIAADGGTVTGTAIGPAAPCTSIGEQHSIVLLVTMPSTPAPDVSPASVYDIFFATSGRSVGEFWRDNSYAKTWATGDVAGWFTLDANYTCDQTNEIRDAAIRAADPTVDFTQYSRIFIVVAGTAENCGWAGIGTVGCSWLSSAQDGSFVASTSWMLASMFDTRDHGVKLSIHEGGHNLGLNHASSRDFGAEALGAPGLTGTLNEYGDEYSTMGTWTFAHYAAPHKQQLGWFGSDAQTVTTNGSFSIQPVEAAGALHALKIRRGIDDNNWLWVEYRAPIGLYDSTINPLVFAGGLIHYQDPITGERTHVLDFTPETDSWSDPVLVPGKSWSDPYTNVSIAVDSAASDALNLHVAYGPLPCTEASPAVSMSPLNPSAYPGDNVAYTISITNNDAATCAPRSFNLSSLVPGWTTSFSQDSLIVAPTGTASSTMLKLVPPTASPATYFVDATVTTSSSSIDGTANVTVMPPCVMNVPTVSLSSSNPSAYPGDSVTYAVSVTNNDTAACGSRTFSLTSATPSGWPTVFSANSLILTPGAAGSATLGKTIPVGTAAATYDVNATAAATSTMAGTGSATATVKVPPSSLTISVSIAGSMFSKGSTVPITAKVVQGTTGVSGVSVQFTLFYPNGSTATRKVTTDSTGQAVWNYRVGQRDPKGSYQVSAQAKLNGQAASSTPASFSIQ